MLQLVRGICLCAWDSEVKGEAIRLLQVAPPLWRVFPPIPGALHSWTDVTQVRITHTGCSIELPMCEAK